MGTLATVQQVVTYDYESITIESAFNAMEECLSSTYDRDQLQAYRAILLDCVSDFSAAFNSRYSVTAYFDLPHVDQEWGLESVSVTITHNPGESGRFAIHKAEYSCFGEEVYNALVPLAYGIDRLMTLGSRFEEIEPMR